MFTAEAFAFFAAHHGVATTAELVERGVSRHSVVAAVRKGLLVRCHHGVMRLASAPPTLEARCRAACVAWPGAVVAGPTAGLLWGLRRMRDDGLVHLRVRHPDRAPRATGIAARRTRRLAPDDVITRTDGIRLTSKARTAFDLATYMGDRDLSSIHEQLLSQRDLTVPVLSQLGDRLAHPNRPGSHRFQHVVAHRRGDGAAESHLEVVLGELLRAAGVPVVHRQRTLVLPDGRAIRVDLAVDAIRWGVEADHSAWHAGRAEMRRDKQRDRWARLIGWQLDHVTEDDLEQDPRGTVDQLTLLYLHRTAEVLGPAAAAAEAARLGRPWNA